MSLMDRHVGQPQAAEIAIDESGAGKCPAADRRTYDFLTRQHAELICDLAD
jgi:hypothetical protein